MDAPASPLTPAVVLALRESVRWRINDGSVRPEPHVIFSPTMERFICWTDGRPQCAHADPAVVGYLLKAERAEPGFVARLMDTTWDPETMCLEPVERLARQGAIREAAAKVRFAAEEAAREARAAAARLRNVPQARPQALGLDDLLS